MNGHNNVTLIANLAADPVPKTYAGGKTLAEIVLAVNSGSKDKPATFFKATAFAGLGDVATKYLKKGSSVLVTTRFKVRQYADKSGARRQAVELVINEMLMLGDGSGAGENSAQIVGNLVVNPEITTLSNGTSKAKFRVAINDGRRKDAAGKAEVQYIDVVLYDKQAEAAAKILAKGKGVYVAGRLEARTYERKDGTRGDAVEIVGTKFQVLGSKKKADQPASVSGATLVGANDVDDELLPF